MSTQLILYPQTYKGEYNSVSNSVLSEYVVDGRNFSSINDSDSVDIVGGAIAYTSIFAAQPPTDINTWYRYRTTSSVTPNLPTQTSNDLVLNVVVMGALNGSGVYQRLSNLVPGQNYKVTVIGEAVTGYFRMLVFYGNNTSSNIATLATGATNSPFTLYFTAGSTHDVLMVTYFSTGGSGNLTIDSISVTETHGTPSLVYSELNDGQVICDLYEEEDIPLSLSIDDFKNVAEQVKSYSKDFNLPATKRNNQIFNNMFEITRADDRLIFNPYIRTQCVLKQDGFILFEGYLRLIDVKDKEGEISYNVNLYSEVITLADILKDQTFANLDFTELKHSYNKSNIRNSWNDSPDSSIAYIDPGTSGFRDDYTTLRYPFIDWIGDIGLTTNTNTASGPTPNNPELTSLEQAFRPWIQLKYLINQIFAASGFNWTSDFFDSADFGKLYMDFNWGADNNPVQSTSGSTNTFYCNGGQGTHYAGTSYTNLVLDDTGLAFFVFPPNYDSATNIITATANNEIYNVTYDYLITNTDSVTRTVEARYLKNTTEFDYSGVITLAAGDSYVYQGSLRISLDTGDTLQAQFKASSAGVVQQSINYVSSLTFGTNVTFILGVTTITTETILETLRGELGQWDFLKGIMTMFNLVSLVDESNPDTIRIETYADVFINNTNSGDIDNITLASRGIQHDWTEKVDVSEMELKPLTDLNKKTQFQFAEDEDDNAFQVYKNATSGGLYGSKLFDATNFTILEGKKEIIAEPFASTLSKPLSDQFSLFITPVIATKNDDGTYTGFDNSPRILYNNGIKNTGASYYIPEQNGLTSENQTNFLQFSHLSTVPSASATTTDFNFETQQMLSAIGSPPANNLWSTYWQTYVNELYHPDTRIMTLKVNLSPSDVASFKFYDTVFIKNRTFRVNRIDYKPNDLATVEFILIT
jgi:hypothetical protein